MKFMFYGRELEVTLLMGGRFELPLELQCGDKVIQGTVGEIPRDTKEVSLKVWVPGDVSVYGYTMGYGQNYIEPLERVEENSGISFSRSIPFSRGSDKTPQLPTNGGQSVRLLSVQDDGRFHDLVVSLVKQGGQLFVTVQETYSEQLYRAGDVVTCPPLHKTRVHTLKIAQQLLEEASEFVATLPEASTYVRPDIKAQAVNLRPNEGLVLWFADGMNSGAVLAKDRNGVARQYKVHFSRILTVRLGRRFLRAGEKVLFRGTEEIPGKSQFRSQLTDVTVEGMFPGLVKLDLTLAPEDVQLG